MASELIEQFQAVGLPRYSDVADRTPIRSTYEEAKADGERIMRVGNWAHFQVEKYFTLTPEDRRTATDGSRMSGDLR